MVRLPLSLGVTRRIGLAASLRSGKVHEADLALLQLASLGVPRLHDDAEDQVRATRHIIHFCGGHASRFHALVERRQRIFERVKRLVARILDIDHAVYGVLAYIQLILIHGTNLLLIFLAIV